MVLVNLDRFSFVGEPWLQVNGVFVCRLGFLRVARFRGLPPSLSEDLAVQLFNFAPDPGAAVVATHYLSDAISMPIIVSLDCFVPSAFHC